MAMHEGGAMEELPQLWELPELALDPGEVRASLAERLTEAQRARVANYLEMVTMLSTAIGATEGEQESMRAQFWAKEHGLYGLVRELRAALERFGSG